MPELLKADPKATQKGAAARIRRPEEAVKAMTATCGEGNRSKGRTARGTADWP
ncbi:MAG: hypothetical protein FWH47_05700 [Methanomassiliicoccaceae archaeon]|nr:hypothetical protein [Methanomassiliicoccaceae archaeon]